MKKFLITIEKWHDWFVGKKPAHHKFGLWIMKVLMWFIALISPFSLWGFRNWHSLYGTGKYPIAMTILCTMFIICCYLKVIVDMRKFIRKKEVKI